MIPSTSSYNQLQCPINWYFWKREQDFPAGLFHTQQFHHIPRTVLQAGAK